MSDNAGGTIFVSFMVASRFFLILRKCNFYFKGLDYVSCLEQHWI